MVLFSLHDYECEDTQTISVSLSSMSGLSMYLLSTILLTGLIFNSCLLFGSSCLNILLFNVNLEVDRYISALYKAEDMQGIVAQTK